MKPRRTPATASRADLDAGLDLRGTLAGMEKKIFNVEGMTCGHCEMSVKEEIAEIDGVNDVKADHETGEVTVIGEGYTREQIADAVKEAGYTLV